MFEALLIRFVLTVMLRFVSWVILKFRSRFVDFNDLDYYTMGLCEKKYRCSQHCQRYFFPYLPEYFNVTSVAFGFYSINKLHIAK